MDKGTIWSVFEWYDDFEVLGPQVGNVTTGDRHLHLVDREEAYLIAAAQELLKALKLAERELAYYKSILGDWDSIDEARLDGGWTLRGAHRVLDGDRDAGLTGLLRRLVEGYGREGVLAVAIELLAGLVPRARVPDVDVGLGHRSHEVAGAALLNLV